MILLGVLPTSELRQRRQGWAPYCGEQVLELQMEVRDLSQSALSLTGKFCPDLNLYICQSCW